MSAQKKCEILRAVEGCGLPVKRALEKLDVPASTYYRWKRKYGGLGVSEIQRIRELEKENRQLKQLAGDQALAIQILQGATVFRNSFRINGGPVT